MKIYQKNQALKHVKIRNRQCKQVKTCETGKKNRQQTAISGDRKSNFR